MYSDAGFQSLLMWWGDDEIESKAERVKLAEKFNLSIENAHAPTENLNSLWLDTDDGAEVVSQLEKCIIDCKEFGIKIMVLHLTNGSNPPLVSNIGIKRIEQIIKQKNIRPEYILFHYPKPVIVKDNFDMKNWRFSDSSEYSYESLYPCDEFKKNSEYLFNWLSEKGFKYNFIPVLEFDALNKYVCRDNFLEGLLEKYKSIRLCLDTGRLHLQNKIDSGFSDIEIIKRFAKYAEVVHLWNVKVTGNLENSHFPALPGLKVEEGWAPIGDYMKIIKEANKNVKIMFEHRSDLISYEELDNCYLWIESLLK